MKAKFIFCLICVAAVTLTACEEYPYGYGGYGYRGNGYYGGGYGGNGEQGPRLWRQRVLRPRLCWQWVLRPRLWRQWVLRRRLQRLRLPYGGCGCRRQWV